jgi:hypothetical protein
MILLFHLNSGYFLSIGIPETGLSRPWLTELRHQRVRRSHQLAIHSERQFFSHRRRPKAGGSGHPCIRRALPYSSSTAFADVSLRSFTTRHTITSSGLWAVQVSCLWTYRDSYRLTRLFWSFLDGIYSIFDPQGSGQLMKPNYGTRKVLLFFHSIVWVHENIVFEYACFALELLSILSPCGCVMSCNISPKQSDGHPYMGFKATRYRRCSGFPLV